MLFYIYSIFFLMQIFVMDRSGIILILLGISQKTAIWCHQCCSLALAAVEADIASKLSKTLFATWKLYKALFPFWDKLILVSSMRTKQNFAIEKKRNRLDFSFSSLYSPFFFVLIQFSQRCWPFTRLAFSFAVICYLHFIYVVKFSKENAEEGEFLLTTSGKW